MSHNFTEWSPGNDGFGYSEPESTSETENPLIKAEAQQLVNIVTNNCLHRSERKKAYQRLVEEYGHYISPEDAELWYDDTTEEESEASELSDSDASDASEWFCNRKISNSDDSDDSDDSEQCPGESSEAVASQSMKQQLSPNKTDSKGE